MPSLMYPTRAVCLVILDGVGVRQDPVGNAVAAARTPFLDRCYRQFPWVTLEPGGEAVGLPAGQMGNSEVGHMNLGAGRVIYQELTRIDRAIADGSFAAHPLLASMMQRADANGKAVHLVGLCSDGGVHSSLDHLLTLIAILPTLGTAPIYLHLFTDGRDTSPTSGAGFVELV
ncbi:MAG: 2,3-bisphosphoglycerate-independent phosphoglycerate mutase, partial [bacterium]